MGGNIFNKKSLDDVVNEYGDAAAFALLLLGQIYMQTERKPKAVDALYRAVSLNPFLWHAFELLCHLGEKPDAERIFQLSGLENFSLCHGTNPITSLINTSQPLDQPNKAQAPEPMTVDQVSTPVLQLPFAAGSCTVNTRYRKKKNQFVQSRKKTKILFLSTNLKYSIAVRATDPPQYPEPNPGRSNDTSDAIAHHGPEVASQIFQGAAIQATFCLQCRPDSISYVAQVSCPSRLASFFQSTI